MMNFSSIPGYSIQTNAEDRTSLSMLLIIIFFILVSSSSSSTQVTIHLSPSGEFNPKRDNGTCALTQSILFPLRKLFEEYKYIIDSSSGKNLLPITGATLTTKFLTIPNWHIAKRDDLFAFNVIVVVALSKPTTISKERVAVNQTISVNFHSKESHSLSIAMTRGIKSFELSKSDEECDILVKVVISLVNCTKEYGGHVPLMAADLKRPTLSITGNHNLSRRHQRRVQVDGIALALFTFTVTRTIFYVLRFCVNFVMGNHVLELLSKLYPLKV